MNCNTCRYELSQCLDGRLPSGRRAVVMQHTASCETCAAFWEELQAAQRLTLRLPREKVGESFREQLWDRIRAGEGTPDAVFREPVPVLVKVRYSMTGAAAAAAVLLFGLWLHDPAGVVTLPDEETVAVADDEAQPARPLVASEPPTGDEPVTVSESHRSEPSGWAPRNPTPMLTAAQPFSVNLLAREAARQIESRYDSVNLNLRQLRAGERRSRQALDTQIIVDRILSDAGELRVFAEVLLDLRDHHTLSFPDPDVGAELRLVANTFDGARLQHPSLATVHHFIVPTVQQSPRLARISRHIAVTPLDPYEEAATLVQFNTQRPEIFPKLFIVFGQGDEISPEFGLFRRNHLFRFEDVCGANFVAPRSVVEAPIPQVR